MHTTGTTLTNFPAMNHDLSGPAFVRPKTALLVSVRSAREAKTALLAGAGLIDCKEPGHGPLGRCTPQTWAAIEAKIQGAAPLSAALGEWHEWAGLGDAEIRGLLQHLARFQYAKLGPAGSAGQAEAFFTTFRRLKRLAPLGLKWICVDYADQDRAKSLSRQELLAIATDSNCAGLLIDTFDKTRRQPWGKRLVAFCRSVQMQGLPLALAGGLTVEKIKSMHDIKPAWFAVRGAACRGGGRTGEVSFRRVRRLVRAIA